MSTSVLTSISLMVSNFWRTSCPLWLPNKAHVWQIMSLHEIQISSLGLQCCAQVCTACSGTGLPFYAECFFGVSWAMNDFFKLINYLFNASFISIILFYSSLNALNFLCQLCCCIYSIRFTLVPPLVTLKSCCPWLLLSLLFIDSSSKKICRISLGKKIWCDRFWSWRDPNHKLFIKMMISRQHRLKKME